MAGYGCALVAGVDFDKAHFDPSLVEGGSFFGQSAAPPGTDGCPPDQKRCNATCVSRTDPAFGCGLADCAPCSLPHATETACGVAGACIPKACDKGFDDCDHDPGNGCEADLSRRETCNSCSIACAAGMLCAPSGCVTDCPSPLTACNGSCVDTKTSPVSCGGCDVVCAGGTNADPACVNSACALSCRSGFGDCANNPAKACTPLPKWFVDADGDDYGTTSFVTACARPAGHAPNSGDCNDSNPSIHPNAAGADVPFDGPSGPSYDYDCSGAEEELDAPVHFAGCGACDGQGYEPLAGRAGAGVNNYCGSAQRHVCFYLPPPAGSGCADTSYDGGVRIKCK